jgi:hypothetical protein
LIGPAIWVGKKASEQSEAQERGLGSLAARYVDDVVHELEDEEGDAERQLEARRRNRRRCADRCEQAVERAHGQLGVFEER